MTITADRPTDRPAPRRTKRTAKGALAAGVAAVLLMGGASTLAFWTDGESIEGTPITSGELKLGTPVCGSWLLDGATTFTNQLIVPGDVLSRVCTIDLIATGEHLGATLGISPVAFGTPNALTGQLTSSAAFLVNGASTTTITEANDTNTGEIVATITVSFNGGVITNLSQALTSAINNVSVTATQTHAP